MDPIIIDDPLRIRMDEIITETIAAMDSVESYHDLQVVPGKNHIHIIFDVVMAPDAKASKEEIKNRLTEEIEKEGGQYDVIIDFDQPFI